MREGGGGRGRIGREGDSERQGLRGTREEGEGVRNFARGSMRVGVEGKG